MKPKDTVRNIASQYQRALYEKNHLWDLRDKPKPNVDDEKLKSIVSHTLDLDGLEPDIDKYIESVVPGEDFQSVAFYQMLEVFLQSLREDVEQCLSDEQNQLLKEIPITSLNTGLLDARCVKTDIDGNELDFHLILLNEGLHFSFHQLFAAYVFEKLNDQLEPEQRRDSEAVFDAAIKLYIDPDPKNIEPAVAYVGDISASGEIAKYITDCTSILFQFITLHEFAHAWLDHHRLIENQALSMVATVEPAPKGVSREEIIRQEFEADQFAFETLMKRTKEPISHWAHMVVFYLFFHYLAKIENKLGKPLSPNHPPPLMRAQKLKEYLYEQFPENDRFEADFVEIDKMMQKWSL